jgi:hypothetical protein
MDDHSRVYEIVDVVAVEKPKRRPAIPKIQKEKPPPKPKKTTEKTRKSGKPMYNVNAYSSSTVMQPLGDGTPQVPIATENSDAIVMKLSVFPNNQNSSNKVNELYAFNDTGHGSEWSSFETANVNASESLDTVVESIPSTTTPGTTTTTTITNSNSNKKDAGSNKVVRCNCNSNRKTSFNKIFALFSLLKEFEEKSKNNEWPSSTHVRQVTMFSQCNTCKKNTQ